MPDKSSHGKGKHHSQSKKRREMQRHTITQPPAAAPATPPSAAADILAPRVKTKIASPKAPAAARYPHIAGELKRILILAGIIFIILIVLALVLS